MLTIYSRPGCHLCDEMKAVIEHVTSRLTAQITLEEVDISSEPDLEARYGLEIPVLLVDGRKAAKYRIGKDELMRILQEKAGSRETAE